ncbi:MAG: hypothetical protein ACRC7R_07990 [Sarcina sp.]
MIFISAAMYCEAYPFIKKLNLKKDIKHKKFEVFKNEEVTLIITGTGKIKAAIATTYLLVNNSIDYKDIFINIGVCGTKNESIPIGSVCICNKIVESETKRTFYPDMLIKHPFNEFSIETSSFVVDEKVIHTEEDLIDMEAIGVYQSSSLFFRTHQIFFVKIVSDYLKNTQKLNREELSKLIGEKSDEIVNWIMDIKAIFAFEKDILTKKEKSLVCKVVDNLKLSATMESNLKQCIVYYKLRYGDFTNILDMYVDKKCESKNEGKKHFERLKQELI